MPWHLAAVDAPAAWETATGEGVTVAVIDSGVDADHPDLAGAVLPGRSYVDVDRGDEPRLLAFGSDPGPVYERAFGQADPVGHGTAVAGLIAARAETRHPGVAPDASILPSASSTTRTATTIRRWSARPSNGPSTTAPTSQPLPRRPLRLRALRRSHRLRRTPRRAHRGLHREPAQDEADEDVWFPARVPDVLAVTGSDQRGERWKTAVTGAETDLAAPGADLTAPKPGGGHKTVTGTSFASAVVSGAAALVRSAHPEWAPTRCAAH